MWKVQCEVWGGVTGHRVAMLKENGVECVYATEEEAREDAARLTKAVGQPYANATFSYRAVEV